MGKEIFYLGSAPVNEDCAQVGAANYDERVKKECAAWKSQIERSYKGKWPEGLRLVIKTSPHDFGSYYEVCAVCSKDNLEACEVGVWLDDNVPLEWDGKARQQLK